MSTTDPEYTITRQISGTPVIEREAGPDQRSAQDFLALVDSILAIEGVEAIRWSQFTPYFNDGDACEFEVHSPEVFLGGKFGASAVWRDTYSLHSYDPAEGPAPRTYGSEYREWEQRARVQAINGRDTLDIVEALKNFSAVIARYYHVLYENFGDHAMVTASADGFEIETYSHD